MIHANIFEKTPKLLVGLHFPYSMYKLVPEMLKWFYFLSANNGLCETYHVV